MKGRPWNTVAVLCLIVAVAGCATGRPQTLGGVISGKFGECEFTYQLAEGTTKMEKGSLKLSKEAQDKKCQTDSVNAAYFGDSKKVSKVSDILGTDVSIETREDNVRMEMPRGWCCRWYPNPGGGWTYVCYPC
jgi:hypothetical protein